MAAPGELDPVSAVAVGAVIPAGPLVVALSGGADSAVCAWAAAEAGNSVRAVFVDHGFTESAELAVAARAIALHLGIELDEVSVSVPPGASPEAQARMVRHAALEGALKPDETLLSGHTADDQAETVLGNVLRGAGATGLAGIPGRRDRWVRPLLTLTRGTVRSAADALGLPYRDDPTNESLGPRRNQLRHEVLPFLERFNPQLRASLLRTAGAAAGDDAALDAAASHVPLTATPTAIKIPRAVLETVPAAVAARVARRAIRMARGPHAGTAAEVDAVLAAATGTATTIGEGVQVAAEAPWIVLTFAEEATPQPVPLVVPGSTVFWAGEIAASDGGAAWHAIGSSVITVDAAQPLSVRVAAPGEEIAIEGGHKRVRTVLAEAGVPERLRPHWPVLDAGGTITWIVSVRAAPRTENVERPALLHARLMER